MRTVSLGDFAVDARATQVGQAMWLFNEDLWSAAFETLPDYAVDMEKAAALLAESGVADQLDGKVITVDENPVRIAQALALQDAVAQLGHTLEIEKITFPELISRSFSGARDYDIIVTNWGSDFPDPAGNLLPNYASQNVGDGGANFSNYIDPKIDELLNGQHAEVDNAKRSEMMIEAQAPPRRGLPAHRVRLPQAAVRAEQAVHGLHHPGPLVLGRVRQEHPPGPVAVSSHLACRVPGSPRGPVRVPAPDALRSG